MQGELIVDQDKKVSIKRIIQWQTYDGLLEGLPTTKMNSRILENVENEAKKFCGIEEVFLIEPKQSPIPYDGKYPFGEPASLPPIICVVELWHFTTFKNKHKDFSSLGLIWFQNDFAFPIEEEILEQIKKVPFSKICGEFAY